MLYPTKPCFKQGLIIRAGSPLARNFLLIVKKAIRSLNQTIIWTLNIKEASDNGDLNEAGSLAFTKIFPFSL